MANIDFPSSPALNDTYTLGTRTWQYNGRAWQLITVVPQGSPGYTGSRGATGYVGSASTIVGYTGSTGAGYTGSRGDTGYVGSRGYLLATVSTTAPTGPSIGDLWVDSADGTQYFYINDGNSSAWVELANDGLQGPQGIRGYTGSGYAASANIQMNSLGVGAPPSQTTGEIRATGNITAYYSDDRLKTRLGNIENAVEKVMSLDAFYYEANDMAQQLGYKPVREVGLSAQQVKKVLAEVVTPAPIDEQYLTVRYERVIPLLVAAIKEQQQRIDELTTIIEGRK